MWLLLLLHDAAPECCQHKEVCVFSFHPLCLIFFALAFIGDELLTTGTAAPAIDDLGTLTLTADRSPASRAKMLMGVCWVSEGLADAGTQHGETAQGHSTQ